MKNKTVQPKKRRGPAPTGKGTPVQVRMQTDALAKVDAWAKSENDKPTRPEAIRRLIDVALRERK